MMFFSKPPEITQIQSNKFFLVLYFIENHSLRRQNYNKQNSEKGSKKLFIDYIDESTFFNILQYLRWQDHLELQSLGVILLLTIASLRSFADSALEPSQHQY